MSFNRSEFLKELHNIAKQRRKFYAEKFPDKPKPAYSEFLKNDNPVDANIIVYEVSYQLSYESAKQGLKMKNPQTFTIYALAGIETSDSIYEKTKMMVLDMKGEKTGENLNLGTRAYFDINDDYLNIEVAPRGLEKVESKRIVPKHYDNLLKGDFVVEQLDNKVSLTNKKNYSSRMNLDIRHFM